MKGKILTTLVILALLVIPITAIASAEDVNPDPDPVDVGPEIRGWEATRDRLAGSPSADAPLAPELDPEDYPCYIETKTWLSLDNYDGFYFFDDFYLIAETEMSELWVQWDLSYPEGDPRPTPEVTCEQAAYLLDEFDNNMYPIETDFFGPPDLHDGSLSLLEAWGYVPPGYYANAAGRQVVLVSNVIDESYYDPTYPNYIAGFYSPTFEAYFDRNIMSIDSHDWANRVGPDGSRPYLYESVFAHEYQHLLHDDYDPDEVTWINEGLSMFAEYLTGYVVNEDPYSTFQEYPENSLTAWEDQGGREIVADYGIVFLFQMYLYERYGPEFIQAEFQNPENGIASVETVLDLFTRKFSFARTYHDFSVAVLIDAAFQNFRYGFELLDVGIDIGTPEEPNPEAFDTPGAPPWGGDYIFLEDFGIGKQLHFDGEDTVTLPTPWTSDGDVLYSGTGDLIDNWAIIEVAGGGDLVFDANWWIEDYWDFGFVQVSTDGGYTWTSLANDYTTDVHDPSAIGTVVDNLPGLTGDSCLLSEDCWVNMSFDLSPYAGQDILLAFRYVTDWATPYDGWWIDNIYANGVLVSDGSDASIFMSITELFPVDIDFQVTLVGRDERDGYTKIKKIKLRLDDETEEIYYDLDRFEWMDEVVMIVTYDAAQDWAEDIWFYADYEFEVLTP